MTNLLEKKRFPIYLFTLMKKRDQKSTLSTKMSVQDSAPSISGHRQTYKILS